MTCSTAPAVTASRAGRLAGAALLAAATLALAGCMTMSPTEAYVRGQLAAEHGDLNVALADLSHAIESNPKLTLAFIARGNVYKQKGDYQKAASDYRLASDLEPRNFDAVYNLGLMYQYLQRFSEAVDAYQHAVEIRPLDPEANMNLAIVYTQIGQPLRGLPYAQRAVTGSSESPHTHANLGILYASLGYQDRAIEQLRKAIELNAKAPEVYLDLGAEYMKAERWELARNVLLGAVKLGPNAAVEERLGLTYYKTGALEDAAAAYRAALQVDGKYTPALNGLGVVLMTEALKSGQTAPDKAKEAVTLWKTSLALDPNQPAISRLVERYGNK